MTDPRGGRPGAWPGSSFPRIAYLVRSGHGRQGSFGCRRRPASGVRVDRGSTVGVGPRPSLRLRLGRLPIAPGGGFFGRVRDEADARSVGGPARISGRPGSQITRGGAGDTECRQRSQFPVGNVNGPDGIRQVHGHGVRRVPWSRRRPSGRTPIRRGGSACRPVVPAASRLRCGSYRPACRRGSA